MYLISQVMIHDLRVSLSSHGFFTFEGDNSDHTSTHTNAVLEFYSTKRPLLLLKSVFF